jgi:peptide/nickel transport system permease protein
MAWFALRRIAAMVPILLLVTLVAFVLLHLAPGDPAQAFAGTDASPEALTAARKQLGLDDPLPVQYGRYVLHLAQGDLGESFTSREPVSKVIFRRLPATLSITAGALLVALLISIPAGMLAALHPRQLADRLTVISTSMGIALPDFFFGLLLVLVVALQWNWLPATGYVPFLRNPLHWALFLILPVLTLSFSVTAELTRQVRAGLIETLSKDYVRTARAKGLPGYVVVGKHALKNASVPIVTVFGLQVRRLLGGTVIVEQIFNVPGIGSLIVKSVFERDLPVVLGITVVSAIVVLLVNLLVDLSYGYLDPRVRG